MLEVGPSGRIFSHERPGGLPVVMSAYEILLLKIIWNLSSHSVSPSRHMCASSPFTLPYDYKLPDASPEADAGTMHTTSAKVICFLNSLQNYKSRSFINYPVLAFLYSSVKTD